MDETPTAADFEALLDTTFAVTVDDALIELQLVKVDVKTAERMADTFTVEFHGPAGVPLPQSIYHMTYASGAMDLFLVPVAGDDDGYTYEAVFSRIPD